eukprot:CAMPEP_0201125934 /NCGR_PEP_ID=MMETSP0850-20130426/23842_1 /ASSEMBLY_ACC=CAM_ASM_000622 /TAXON_ID=183588 /ORGANISM="Pseudo-nitzschia fraudulenta, Strain WWA7" /LENGTH=256 /DNA_ID=CAMNT_0047394153 /DNA_START=363 /DNA_END=1130 /DNA_ORIENTATION=-
MLEKAGGVSYRQSVCTPQEMDSIRKDLSLVLKRHLTKERSSIAQNRFGATLTKDQTGETIRILEEGSIYRLVQRLAGSSSSHNQGGNKARIDLSREIPVEVRLYEQAGASMAWHRDDIMYDPPQLEVVFTFENNSNCVTMWKVEQVGNQNNNKNGMHQDEMHSQETNPNSLLLLLAGGPEHCVTSLKRGRRVILKCAYVYEEQATSGKKIITNSVKQKGKKEALRENQKSRKENGSRRNDDDSIRDCAFYSSVCFR